MFGIEMYGYCVIWMNVVDVVGCLFDVGWVNIVFGYDDDIFDVVIYYYVVFFGEVVEVVCVVLVMFVLGWDEVIYS